jgi:NitT/TauT family transport system substrate-binding protein
MNRFTRVLLCCTLTLGVALTACAVPDPLESDETLSPFANNATSAPTDASPVASALPTSNATAQTTAGALPQSTASSAVAATNEPSKGTITFAFDSYPTYFPGILIETKGLLAQRGYDLQLVPFLLDGRNNVSEAERYEKLANGEWDVLATTLENFALHARPGVGAVTTIIDESAGTDRIVVRPEITKVNDLKGKRVAFSDGSVGEYFLYYALNLAGMTPSDIEPLPKETVADAVRAYVEGEADAVSGWDPAIRAAENKDGVVLVSSDKLRTILDVLVVSRPALDNKSDAVQAFHDAWYDALRIMIDMPDQAGQSIVEWGHTDWTVVTKPEDLSAQLQGSAQATLGSNVIAFQSPQVIVDRLREARTIWLRVGDAQTDLDDFSPFVDGRFVLASAEQPQLFSTRAPINSSFLLTARVDADPLAADGQESQSVAQLPLEQIDFEPETIRLTQQASTDLSSQVLPILRSSKLYLQIQGGAAWPGPEGRYTREDIQKFARERAVTVASFLTQQGIDPNRLVIGDPLEPQCPNCLDENAMASDRIVRFVLIGGGR